jgi:hypothetical protein
LQSSAREEERRTCPEATDPAQHKAFLPCALLPSCESPLHPSVTPFPSGRGFEGLAPPSSSGLLLNKTDCRWGRRVAGFDLTQDRQEGVEGQTHRGAVNRAELFKQKLILLQWE